MTIILDNVTIPEKGTLEIKIDRTVEINVTAEQARKMVDRWLMEYVSSQMGAENPTLVAGERVVWRVPAYISLPSIGRIKGIGTVDVDVMTGEMLDMEGKPQMLIEYLEKEVKPRLPAYKLGTSTSDSYLPNDKNSTHQPVIRETPDSNLDK